MLCLHIADRECKSNASAAASKLPGLKAEAWLGGLPVLYSAEKIEGKAEAQTGYPVLRLHVLLHKQCFMLLLEGV